MKDRIRHVLIAVHSMRSMQSMHNCTHVAQQSSHPNLGFLPMFRSDPRSGPRPSVAVHALRPAPHCPLCPCSPSYLYHCVDRIHLAPSSGYDSAIPWGICAAGSMLGQETRISYVTRRRIARCKFVRTCQETQGRACLQRTGLLHPQLPSWMLRPVQWRIWRKVGWRRRHDLFGYGLRQWRIS